MRDFGSVPTEAVVLRLLSDAADGTFTSDVFPNQEFSELLISVSDAGEVTDEDRQEALRIRQEAEDELTFGPAEDSAPADSEPSP